MEVGSGSVADKFACLRCRKEKFTKSCLKGKKPIGKKTPSANDVAMLERWFSPKTEIFEPKEMFKTLTFAKSARRLIKKFQKKRKMNWAGPCTSEDTQKMIDIFSDDQLSANEGCEPTAELDMPFHFLGKYASCMAKDKVSAQCNTCIDDSLAKE